MWSSMWLLLGLNVHGTVPTPSQPTNLSEVVDESDDGDQESHEGFSSSAFAFRFIFRCRTATGCALGATER